MRWLAAALPLAAAAGLLLSGCGGSSRPKVYTSPEAPGYVQPKGRTIQGVDSKTIGTIVVRRRSVLHWASDSPVFQLWDAGQHIRVRTQEHAGTVPLAPGRYRKVSVIAFGRWLITISPA
jgi:hypothetical protein